MKWVLVLFMISDFLYKPLGVPNNEWSSLQWLFGGIITAVYIYSENKIIKGIALLSGAIILCLALVSFSRGIYLAGIVFIILLIVLEHRKLFERKKIIIGGGYCLLVIVVACLYSTEIKKHFMEMRLYPNSVVRKAE